MKYILKIIFKKNAKSDTGMMFILKQKQFLKGKLFLGAGLFQTFYT